MPTEVWRGVVGFEDLYQVSDRGRVKSLRKGKILKQRPDKDGYLLVDLHRGAPVKPRTVKVHRLVAEAFHGPQPEDKPEVDHKNRVRTENHASNLRWSTKSGNRVRVESLGASGAVGVRFRPDKPKPWQAYACPGKKFTSLGHFETRQQAVDARRGYDSERSQSNGSNTEQYRARET